MQKHIHIIHLPPACSVTSQHFNLPPCYENHQTTISISLNTASSRVRIEMGDQGATFLLMALFQGPGGPKVLFGTYFHMQKVKKWAQP